MLSLLCVNPNGLVEFDTFDWGADRDRYIDCLDLGAYIAVVKINGTYDIVDLPD